MDTTAYPSKTRTREEADATETSPPLMQQRASHFKSRRGCQNCKKRHVKCDEQRPHCANCSVRNTICVYGPPAPPASKSGARARHCASPHPRHASSQGQLSRVASSPSASSSPSSFSSRLLSVGSNPAVSLSAAPSAFSSGFEASRLAELELMHRWSTRTWKSLYQTPEDAEFLQVYLPRAALENVYLMNALLALSAADLSRTSGQSSHLYAVSTYNHRANTEFATQLASANMETASNLYIFSVLAATLHFSMSIQGALDRLLFFFESTSGAIAFLFVHTKWLPPCAANMLNTLDIYSMDWLNWLDPDTSTALDYLTSVNHELHDSDPDNESTEMEVVSNITSLAYQTAIAHVKSSFAEEVKGNVQGYCLSMVPLAGAEYFAAVKRHEPVALLIMLYYGVLFDRLSQDAHMWWVASVGRDLVRDISETLQNDPISCIPDAKKAISWTRQQVGLLASG